MVTNPRGRALSYGKTALFVIHLNTQLRRTNVICLRRIEELMDTFLIARYRIRFIGEAEKIAMLDKSYEPETVEIFVLKDKLTFRKYLEEEDEILFVIDRIVFSSPRA